MTKKSGGGTATGRRTAGAALRLLAPAAFSFLQLYYFRTAYALFYHFLPLPAWTIAVVSAPPLLLEYAATRAVEARRLRGGTRVWLPMAARMLFLAALCALFFLYPYASHGRPAIYAPLVGLWHFVAYVSWSASPPAALLAGSVIAAAYWALVYRRAMFRLTVTVLLPGLATAALFALFYFFPESPLRGFHAPAKGVERVFPAEDLRPARGGPWPEGTLFIHDLLAAADGSWLAASLGPTFGGKEAAPPSFVWIDLKKKEFTSFNESSQARRFSSECGDSLFFGPWHRSYVAEYAPGGRDLKRHALPPIRPGSPVEEIFAVHNACGRVYALTNADPAVFELDASGRVLRSLYLPSAGLLDAGAAVFQLIRNPRRRSLLISAYGRDPGSGAALKEAARMAFTAGAVPGRRLIELDEDTLTPLNSAATDYPSMDLTLSPDGKRLYSPRVFKRGIYELDADTLRVLRVIPSPPHIRKLLFSHDGSRLYAADYLHGKVAVYDASSMTPLGSFYVTPRPEGLAIAGGYLYVAGAGGIFRIGSDRIAGLLRR